MKRSLFVVIACLGLTASSTASAFGPNRNVFAGFGTFARLAHFEIWRINHPYQVAARRAIIRAAIRRQREYRHEHPRPHTPLASRKHTLNA